MEQAVLKHRGYRYFSRLCLVIFVMMSALSTKAFGYYETKLMEADVYSEAELKQVIESHQTQIDVLDNQIKTIAKDIDWLVLKINRIQDRNQKAPKTLFDSVADKEDRIDILSKEKTRLEKLVSHYETILDSKRKKTVSTVKSPMPKMAQKRAVSPGTSELMKKSPVKQSRMTAPYDAPVKSFPNQLNKKTIEAAVKKAGLADWVAINGDETCLRMETTLPILFTSGSARIAKAYQDFLQKLAKFLKPYDVKVLVNGYADTDPINTAQYPSNFELGASRAANIVHELVKQGLKPSIFKIETTGEHRFAALKTSPQKSFQRRARVTVIFSG